MKNKPYSYYDVPNINSFKELIDFCAENYGSKIAFRFRKRKAEFQITYTQFKSDIEAMGTYLYSIGMKNKNIALLSENCYEWIVSYFAIVNGNNVVVPIDKDLDIESIKNQIEKSDCELVIHSDSYFEEAQHSGKNCLNLKDFSVFIHNGRSLIEKGYNDFILCEIDTTKTCEIVFTSGTTSEPKGVMLSQKNFISDMLMSSKNLLLHGGLVTILPFYHTYGFMVGVVAELLRGHFVYINDSLRRLMNDIQYAKPVHLICVPLMVEVIYKRIISNIAADGKEKQFNLLVKLSNNLLKIGIDMRRRLFSNILNKLGGNLELIVSGGSPLEEKYLKFFHDIGINISNGYGITECSPVVASIRNKHYLPGSVGLVNPGIEIRIVDGEIQLKGDNIFREYYKDKKATELAFDSGWFKTGDLGYLDKNGFLFITGRKKNLIILSNGKNISPEELETKLAYTINEIDEVLVYAENNKIIAEIYIEKSDEKIRENVNRKLADFNNTMPYFKQIAKVRFRDEAFSKTSTMKIKRTLPEDK